MATFKLTGGVTRYQDKLVAGMVRRGYARDFAERVFAQIEGFGSYGFPESHAASFAHLVYASSWVKCHHPAVFACALLNSQPMGFYAPAQIVRDAREHGVVIGAVDVNASDWDCTLEPVTASTGGLALRLGLRLVGGLPEAEARAIVAARQARTARPSVRWRIWLGAPVQAARRWKRWPRRMPSPAPARHDGGPPGMHGAWPAAPATCRSSPLPAARRRPRWRSRRRSCRSRLPTWRPSQPGRWWWATIRPPG
jgi:error-prone DNA polymerase